MNDFSWFPYALGSMLLLGTQMALFKLPTVRKQSRSATLTYSLLTTFVLALIFFHRYLHLTTWELIVGAAAWGITFSLLSLSQMYALGHLDTNKLFPATSTLSMASIVALGVFIWGDKISLTQLMGVALVILIAFFHSYSKGKFKFSKIIFLLGVATVITSVASKSIAKFTASNFDIHALLIYQYMIAGIFMLGVALYQHKKDLLLQFSKKSALDGVLIGLLGFGGSYLMLKSLSVGPISLVYGIHSLYIIVTATVGYLLLKEKVNLKIILLLLLAVISTLLIRLG